MKIVVASLIMALAFLFSSFNTEYAKSEAYYTVENGDTLWYVAGKYFNQQDKENHFGEFQYSIREANKELFENNRQLQPGDIIVIPLYKEVKE